MVTIRPPGAADVDACVRLGGLFLASSPYGRYFPFKPDVLRALVERIFADGVAFVAEVDGAVVGMIGGFAFREGFAGELMLDELAWFVDPACRRGSLGPRLLAAWETWARQNGIAALRMVAPRGAYHVAAFYERLGYDPIDTAYLKRLDDGTTTMARRRQHQTEGPVVHPPGP